MTQAEIPLYRLVNQFIAYPLDINPRELVSRMGAMQAQDFAMAKRAIGFRLLNASDAEIEKAFNQGQILRTHLLRPTWHFADADDIGWMLTLTAPHIRRKLSTRRKHLEITDMLLSKSRLIIRSLLSESAEVTRDELNAAYIQAGIKTDDNRLAHLLLEAELDRLVCSGPLRNGKQTWALLEKRVPGVNYHSYEASLAQLAVRYFTSHGPATIQDFCWWSGLPFADARRALSSLNDGFSAAVSGKNVYWFAKKMSGELLPRPDNVHLLPAYDEFLISYRDRSASISDEIIGHAVSSNGIFYPTLLINGQVAGLWKLKKSGQKHRLEIKIPFRDSRFDFTSEPLLNSIETEVKRLADFSGEKLELFIRTH